MKNFNDHILLYVTVPVIVIISTISFYRFIIKHDYVIGYQGSCNPATEKCFINCNNDACTDESYYSKMQKYMPDLYMECGADITNCQKASVCLTGDRECSITYCHEKTSGDMCSILPGNNKTESPKEQSLLNNNNTSS